MHVEVHIVSAFIDSPTGGNKAGVVLNSDQLSVGQKLSVAKQVGLSETAFVSASQTADIKLEFFTPTRQIAHCGHATVATFSYLKQLGMINKNESSKETIDGIREIQFKNGLAFMQQSAPLFTEIKDEVEAVAEALGLEEAATILQPIIINTGNSFIVVGVKDKQTLSKIHPNQTLIAKMSELHDLIGFYVFSLDTFTSSADASTRMFAPRYGISEESATGMAAGPLACYLYDIMGIKKTHFEIEQGYAMNTPAPSRILVELEIQEAVIQSVYAGGKGELVESFAVPVSQGSPS